MSRCTAAPSAAATRAPASRCTAALRCCCNVALQCPAPQQRELQRPASHCTAVTNAQQRELQRRSNTSQCCALQCRCDLQRRRAPSSNTTFVALFFASHAGLTTPPSPRSSTCSATSSAAFFVGLPCILPTSLMTSLRRHRTVVMRPAYVTACVIVLPSCALMSCVMSG